MPPPQATFASAGGTFRLELSGPADWKPRRSTATLVRNSDGRALWSRELPNAYRPRFVVVDDQGTTALIDEWLNVRSRHAIVVVDSTGRELGNYSFDDVLRALAIDSKHVAEQARYGWWITRPPQLEPGRRIVRIATGGGILEVDLAGGGITVRKGDSAASRTPP